MAFKWNLLDYRAIMMSININYIRREENLINIFLPADDICIQAEEHMLIPKDKSGIYKIYNKNNEVMYIGKAASLRQRICQHMSSSSNSYDINHNFYTIRCIYVDDPFEREIFETFLINTMKPPLNWDKVFTYKSQRYSEKFRHPEIVREEKIEEEIENKRLKEKMKNRCI